MSCTGWLGGTRGVVSAWLGGWGDLDARAVRRGVIAVAGVAVGRRIPRVMRGGAAVRPGRSAVGRGAQDLGELDVGREGLGAGAGGALAAGGGVAQDHGGRGAGARRVAGV